MKDKEIDIMSYDKIVFVDASGDDGFSFRETSGDGSSYSFVVSFLAIDPKDFDYNCNILNAMKDALHLSHDKELKSTTLKRHRFARDAYKELAKLKGNVFSFVAFKKAIYESHDEELKETFCDTSFKMLSGFTHTFPIYALTKTGIIDEGQKVLIVIDHMKQAETEVIAKCHKKFDIPSLIESDIIYRDSKSEKFPLIQLADALAGSVRNYFESTLSPSSLQKYCNSCERQKGMCTRGPALKAWKQLHFSETEKITLSLHKNKYIKNEIMLIAITTLPFKFYKRYLYIDCFFGDTHKKRS